MMPSLRTRNGGRTAALAVALVLSVMIAVQGVPANALAEAVEVSQAPESTAITPIDDAATAEGIASAEGIAQIDQTGTSANTQPDAAADSSAKEQVGATTSENTSGSQSSDQDAAGSSSATKPTQVQVKNPYPTYNYFNSASDYQVACTWYVWKKAHEQLGLTLPSWGNAGDWYARAKDAGYEVGTTPKVNAIACWSTQGTPAYGHVALVTKVESSTSFALVEAGSEWDENDHGVCSRTVKSDAQWPDLGFIYLNASTAKSDASTSAGAAADVATSSNAVTDGDAASESRAASSPAATASQTADANPVAVFASAATDKPATTAKAANPLAVTVKKTTVSVTYSATKARTCGSNITVSDAVGNVTYINVSKNATAKAFAVKKTGAVTVPKGCAAGTYLVKVKVRAAGNAAYKAGSKTVSFKVAVRQSAKIFDLIVGKTYKTYDATGDGKADKIVVSGVRDKGVVFDGSDGYYSRLRVRVNGRTVLSTPKCTRYGGAYPQVKLVRLSTGAALLYVHYSSINGYYDGGWVYCYRAKKMQLLLKTATLVDELVSLYPTAWRPHERLDGASGDKIVFGMGAFADGRSAQQLSYSLTYRYADGELTRV